jgi:hypothetical protein
VALVLLDRVQQTGTANTTVSFTLSGSVTGFQSFSVIGNGNTTYYSSFDASGNWEVGLGTYSTTGPTLTRTTIISSSNSGSAVTFSGTVNVFVTYPAEQAVLSSNNAGTTGQVLTSNGTGVAPTWSTVSASNIIYQNSNFSVASSSNTYLVNTASGAITATLPASPATGYTAIFVDATGTWDTNFLTIANNGLTIMGFSSNLVCRVADQEFTLWYNGSDWRLL